MDNYFYVFISSFLISIFLLIVFIPVFRKIKFSQSIRKEGPTSHYSKNGTPTMGGIFIIISTIISYIVFYARKNSMSFDKLILFLFPIVTYGLIGFLDDSLIIIKKDNKGIKPNTKLLFQILFAIFYAIIYIRNIGDTWVRVFNFSFNLKLLYPVLIVLMLVSSSNAINLSDGLDGLASGLSVIVLLGVSILGYNRDSDVSAFAVCLIGGIIGFLCYNFHPAKLFMGDVGSLAIGSSVASMFILLKIEVLLLIFGFVFIIETLSVIIQVIYFKKTNGKRLFLMTPIHHHFELKGLKEWQIDFLFWIIAIVLGTIGIYLGYKFY